MSQASRVLAGSAVFFAGALLAAGLLVQQPASAQRGFGGPPPDPAWQAEKARQKAVGEKYATAWDLYQHFREEAAPIRVPGPNAIPDWSGLWTREAGPFVYDADAANPAQGPNASVMLTPEYQKEFTDRLAAAQRGVEYDPLSTCGTPVGFPRWFTEPFLREYVPTPKETWLILEQQSEIRRIYTDGRDHIPEDFAVPTANGDSIGFWDGDKLVAHTKYVKPGMIQRNQPSHSDKIEGVEIWQKTDAETIIADVWLYDPEAFVKPWYTRQKFVHVPQPADGYPLRIAFWDCTENQNNDITQTAEGSSTFTDLSFTKEDDQP
jgi:hypothetical protein